MKTFYEDCLAELAIKLAAGEIPNIKVEEVDALVVEKSKRLERDNHNGTYVLQKPSRAKVKTKCPHCTKEFVNLDRHINLYHSEGGK